MTGNVCEQIIRNKKWKGKERENVENHSDEKGNYIY